MEDRSLKRVYTTPNPHCHCEYARSNGIGGVTGIGSLVLPTMILIGIPFFIGAAVGCYRYKDK